MGAQSRSYGVSHLQVYTWILTCVLESLMLSITKVHSDGGIYELTHLTFTGLSDFRMLKSTKHFFSGADYASGI